MPLLILRQQGLIRSAKIDYAFGENREQARKWLC